MPFGKCPSCGQSFHLNVADVEAWYRERWPSVPIGAEVAEECAGCWAKRTGVAVRLEERYRPYGREELRKLPDGLPDRGARCGGCGEVVPRFTDLTPEVEQRIRKLILEGARIMATQELVAATGCSLRWAKIWMLHPWGPELHEKSGRGPACAYCGKPLRSPLACQCVECGMDWHDARRVFRLGEAPSEPSECAGPPDRLDGFWVAAWAVIGDRVRPTGKTRHLTMEGPLPPAAALALAKDEAAGAWYVFHCDAVWNTIADTCHTSLAEAQSQAGFEFEGIGRRWSYRPPPSRP